MKAAIQTKFGSPDVLTVQEVQTPTIGDDEVLVRVYASSVTQGDRRLRAADFPGISQVIGRLMFGVFSPRNPIVGTNFAGRVVAVGSAVTKFAVGDDVFGSCGHSACAEYLAIGQGGALAHLPEGVTYEEGAAAPYGAATALVFMRDLAKVKAGDRVLVVGASGGVGRFAVQIAADLGARVTGVSSRAKFDLVRQLGAEKVVDYRTDPFSVAPGSYDVIFDTHSGDGFQRAKGALTPSGRFATLFLTPRVMLQMLITSLIGGPKVVAGVALPSQALTNDVARLLRDRAIRPVVAKVYPLAAVAEAHAALESQSPQGAVVVSLPEAA